jgi:Spy/CpxP family protein refolding chaperone
LGRILFSIKHQTIDHLMNTHRMFSRTLAFAMILCSASAGLHALPGRSCSEDSKPGEQHQFHNGHGARGLHERQNPVMKLLERSEHLQLSEEQELSLIRLSRSHRQERDAHRQSMKEAMKALENAAELRPFDEAAYRKVIESVQPVFVEGMLLRARHRSAIESVLNEDQLSKLKEIKGRFHKAKNLRGGPIPCDLVEQH